MAIDPALRILLQLNGISRWDRLPILVEVPGVSRSVLTEREYYQRFIEMTEWCYCNCVGKLDRRGDFADRPSRTAAFKFEIDQDAALFKLRFV